MTIATEPVHDKIWPSDDDPSPRYPIFTRANTGEVFVDAATPFTWSLLGRVVYEGGYRDALIRLGAFATDDFRPEGHGLCECVGSFGGYVYINLSMSRVFGVRAPGMTTDAIDRSFLGDHPDIRPYRPHPDDDDEDRSAAMGAWMGSILASPDVSANERHREEIDALVAERPELSALTETELLARAVELTDRLRPVFATHIVNLYGANVVTGLLTQCCDVAGIPEVAATIISGFGDVDSAQQSFDLWEISRLVRSLDAVTRAYDGGLPGLSGRLDKLDGSDAGVSAYRAAWGEFMQRWGFLGPSVWELRSPTYATESGMVLHMLDGARKVPDSGSPTSRTSQTTSARSEATARVAAALEGTELHDQFAAAAHSAPVLLPAREASKVQCTRIVDEIRMVVRELGQRYVDRGELERWQDVLLMMYTEMPEFLADPSAWTEVVADRKARLAELELRRPPFLLDGTYPELEDYALLDQGATEAAAVDDELAGIGVSPGVHRGRVKVVDSLRDDVDIDDGDVLVAMTTDSSWGPLFLSAGAVVCQTGAAISHAAIVSRELGIPAAVSVPYCTELLRTGMEVSVDGSTGRVTVLSVP